MGAHDILNQTDRALVAYLISKNAGTPADVYPAKRSADKSLPDTICFSSKAHMMTANSGVYVVSAMVQVRTDPTVDVNQTEQEKESGSRDRVAATYDAFWVGVDSSSEQLADAITQAGRGAGINDFTVQSCEVLSMEAGFNEKGNGWTDTLDLEIVCCPLDVS